MNGYIQKTFFAVAICISCLINAPGVLAVDTDSSTKIDTPQKAAEFASNLANKKTQKSFGISPFTPDSYSAQLIGSKWRWGKIEPPGIRGYSAEVEFNTDGSGQKVRAVLHTDTMFNNLNDSNKVPIEMEVIEQAPIPSEGAE